MGRERTVRDQGKRDAPTEKKGHPLFFFRLASNAFSDIGSVGRSVRLKKKPKKRKKSLNRRPGTPASLLWSLETTRHEPKINMAETLVGVNVL